MLQAIAELSKRRWKILRKASRKPYKVWLIIVSWLWIFQALRDDILPKQWADQFPQRFYNLLSGIGMPWYGWVIFILTGLFLMLLEYAVIQDKRIDELTKTGDIGIRIIRKLDPLGGDHYFKGRIINKRSVKNMNITLEDVQQENGEKAGIQDRTLYWPGNVDKMIPKDFRKDENPEFDIGVVGERATTELIFLGHRSKSPVHEALKEGLYTFNIGVLGDDMDKMEQHYKIKIKPGGGKDSLEILEGETVEA